MGVASGDSWLLNAGQRAGNSSSADRRANNRFFQDFASSFKRSMTGAIKDVGRVVATIQPFRMFNQNLARQDMRNWSREMNRTMRQVQRDNVRNVTNVVNETSRTTLQTITTQIKKALEGVKDTGGQLSNTLIGMYGIESLEDIQSKLGQSHEELFDTLIVLS